MLAPLVAASQHALAAALELMRGAYRRLHCRLCYALKVQCPRALDSAARAELELLLRAAHGDRDYSALFRDKGRLYTATFQNRTVACVFTYSVDCDFRGTDRPVWNVRALSVLPAHRRQGLAARLLARVKRDAARNEAVWLELHVDEKRDRSHECLLEMYRKLGFLVLPRPQQAEYLLLCMDL
jgi:GNAT superfamily N-acetyltransferase